MANKVAAFAAHSAKDPLVKHDIVRREPREDDVDIDILYCGVCHSDLHCARNDWGFSFYPIVPGHEIIGRVRRVGAKVTQFKVGENVGVGCMVDSCQHCAACKQGLEQYCAEGCTGTYNSHDRIDHTPTYGGYSKRIVVRDQFVCHIPDGVDLKSAAPLLCAGITTWSPLRHWKVGPGSKVAVVGLGGLGHMALKLAHALGADVSLFTRTPGKEADARRLGADKVVLSTDAQQMAAVASQFDLIVDTVPYDHDLNVYMPTLKFNGTLCIVGYLGELKNLIHTVPAIMGRRTIAGSMIGGIAETQEMLNFCGKFKVAPDVEMIPMQAINQSYERMQRSDVKYRFVIDMASLV